MSEMIQRVAFATCTCMPCICKNRAGFEGMPCLERGRSGIAAMRDPTEEMWCAGLAGINECGGNSIEVWQAMIDEALE